MNGKQKDLDAIRARLEEIASKVSMQDTTLDDALALYEEAVDLSLAACDVTEEELLGYFPYEADGESGDGDSQEK